MSRKGEFFNQINPETNMFENLSQYVTPINRTNLKKSNLNFFHLKGSAQFIFLGNPQKSSINVCLMKILKNTFTKKSNYEFL